MHEEASPVVEGGSERHSGWSYPEAVISGCGDVCEVRFFIPGLEPESVVVEIGEDLLVLSGLRWEGRPGEKDRRLRPFRRLIDLPCRVADESWQASYHDEILVLVLHSGELSSSQNTPRGGGEGNWREGAE